jgi:hypothetical protein
MTTNIYGDQIHHAIASTYIFGSNQEKRKIRELKNSTTIKN